MGGKSKAPAAPDYSGLASASQQNAQQSYQLGEDQLAWAKDEYAQNKAVTQQVIDSALNTQAANDQAAAADRARYEQVYQPLENSLVADAQSYASPDRKTLEMGRAQATVAQQFDQQRQAAQKNLESFGVDPTSTRYAAMDIGVRAAQGAAEAAAGNQASQVVDATGRALRSEAINVGRGYPGQVAQTYGTALQAGNQAVNSGLATTASGANTMGTATQWNSMGNQGLGQTASIMNTGFNNALGSFNANQNASSGIGSALGLVGGLINGTSNASGASGLGAIAAALADGGAIPDVGAPLMGAPMSGQASEGGAIPVGASPTMGRAIDDVPARLTPGEFVVPKDAVAWYGEKHLQNMINKSRQDRQNVSAKPQMKPAIPAAPTFTSRPTALPVG